MKTRITFISIFFLFFLNIKIIPGGINNHVPVTSDTLSNISNEYLPGSLPVRHYSPDELIKKRFLEKNGKEVIAEIVPGSPPLKYRAPKAKIPNTAKIIENVPAYSWSFGCSATSGAMIAGYYDNKGYWKIYTGPQNGSAAPMNNSIWGKVVINGEERNQCPLSASKNGLDGKTTRGHVDDYWIKYENCDDDPYISNGIMQHLPGDCTADYMKTNQSLYSNCDGGTTFFYNIDRTPYSEENPDDGLYGLALFFRSKNYSVIEHYSQRIAGYLGIPQGFTFAQFKQEIDNGYPVIIHVTGHTMVGVGYDDASNKIFLHDTWDYNTHEMTWGGDYHGLEQRGVSVIHLAPVDTTNYSVNVFANPLYAGTVSGKGSFLTGMNDTVRAVPNTGYTFICWSENGVPVSYNPDFVFGVTRNRTLYADFSTNSYRISAVSFPVEGGVITGMGNYYYGQIDTLKAVASPGYYFSSWTENGTVVSYNSSYIFTVNSQRTLQANFTRKLLTITTISNPLTGGIAIGGGGFYYGAADTVRATPNLGYTFISWTENGLRVSSDPVYSFIVTGNRNLTANFLLTDFSVLLNSNPDKGGIVTGAGSFPAGYSNTINAIANAGYTFIGWTENDSLFSIKPKSSFKVNRNFSLSALFAGIFLTMPKGGEVLTAGSTCSVTWNSANVANLKIEFSSNDGSTWNSIALSVPASSGLFNWIVPIVSSSKCKIRLTDLLNPEIFVQCEKSFTINSPGIKFSAKLLYANEANSPLEGVKAFLYDPVNKIDSAITGADGRFSFNVKKNSTYKLLFESTFAWGGVNATDALLISKHYIYGSPFSPVQIRAADVNNSGSINNTDAFLVAQKSIGLDVMFNSGNWVFEDTEFFSGEENTSSVIYCLAAGDVNASYSNSHAKANVLKTIVYSGLHSSACSLLSLPVAINRSVAVGAVSLSFEYDPESVLLTGVTSKLEGIRYNFVDGKASVSWSDVQPVNIAMNEPFLVLSGKLLKTLSKLELTVLAQTEFANKNGEPLEGIDFVNSQMSTNDSRLADGLSNYPNPFNPSTLIKFTLSEPGNVKLVIYSMLGKEVITLLNENRQAGNYEINWNGSNSSGEKVPSGVYICRLSTGKNVYIKKMNLVK